jgi:hypothetical protein
VKRPESLLNSRAVLVFLPLTILFLWGFFVGPIHGLLNEFALAGLIGAAIILDGDANDFTWQAALTQIALPSWQPNASQP